MWIRHHAMPRSHPYHPAIGAGSGPDILTREVKRATFKVLSDGSDSHIEDSWKDDDTETLHGQAIPCSMSCGLLTTGARARCHRGESTTAPSSDSEGSYAGVA